MIQVLNKIEFFLKDYSKEIVYKENNGKFNYNFKDGCHTYYYEPYEKGEKVDVESIMSKLKEYLNEKDKVRLNYLVLKNEDSCFTGNSPRLLGNNFL